jgi:phenylalanyl-tRNA synthetase alpha chain
MREYLPPIEQAKSLEELEKIRQELLGKKGKLTEQMKALGSLSMEEKKVQGPLLNSLRDEILHSIESQKKILEEKALEARLQTEKIDVGLPPRLDTSGSIHPISQTIADLTHFFRGMGFMVAEGPDIEDDFHNFTALNVPEHHPARHEHDTFYLPPAPDGRTMLLRTHTSTVQIRTLQAYQPPLRLIVPGRVYRCDSDMTHTPMFHQLEGLIIEEGIHMGHLKGCIIDFCRSYFDVPDLPVRFRPGFFPFTEPSAEVDISCFREGGKLHIGAGGNAEQEWLEILGCGMIHPQVLRNCGIDPEKYQGFAFGMGVERLTMLKYGIPDLRTFFGGDLRWLSHYGFSILNPLLSTLQGEGASLTPREKRS